MTDPHPVVLVGAGGLGREALAALRAAGSGTPVRGFVDDRPESWDTMIDGVSVLGPVASLRDGSLGDCATVVCTGRPGNTRSRVVLDGLLAAAGVPFATVVHPSAALAMGVTVGDGSVLLAQVVATAPIAIGRHVVVMPQVVFTHDDVIGDYTTFGAGVKLAGGVRVEAGAYVGSGALVRENLTIGTGALVGMGSVVTRDVPPNEVWVGNPARHLRTLEPPALTSTSGAADVDSIPDERISPMSEQPIPLVDLRWQHDQIADEVRPELEQVLASGGFIDGPAVKAFEAEFAAFSGCAHAVGCGSGTDALELALRAADVGPGDEVVIPVNTFVATAEAVMRAGAEPVFVDADPVHLLMDAELLEAAVAERTAAIMPVHLYGQFAPMGPILETARRHDLKVIADAAQAQAATGDGQGIAAGVIAAGTSFYPGKNLGAAGDAGAVVTDDEAVADLVRSISHHGAGESRYHHVRFGCTSRLDTVHAVVLRAKLARLEKWNELRRGAAAVYDELLADVDEITTPAVAPGNVPVWHLYVVQVDRRDEVLAALQAASIGAGIHYPIPLHRQPVFAGSPAAGQEFPVATATAARILSLPIFPGITESQQERVVQELRAAVG